MEVSAGFAPGTAANLSVEVELTISARNLHDQDEYSKSDPMCVVFVQPFGKNWCEVGRTEVLKNTLNPDFAVKIKMLYCFEEQQKLQFKIFDVDDYGGNLDAQDFLGEMECTLGQIVSAKVYESHIKKRNVTTNQKITIVAEETGGNKEELEVSFSCSKLKKSGLFSTPDPFLSIYKDMSEIGQRILIHRTNYINDCLSPSWPKFTIPLRAIKTEDGQYANLLLQCFNFNQNGDHKLMGQVEINSRQLLESPANFPLKKKSSDKEQGILHLRESTVRQVYSFLDYVSSGTQLNCTFAIDFTGSNGHPQHPSSLHYLSPQPNLYEIALRAVGSVIQDYDSDKQFPVLGFGAAIPPDGRVSHQFFVNMNPTSPYCAGIDGVLAAYRSCLQCIQLQGPTNFAPVINHVARFAASHPDGDHYFILLILTDGEICDMTNTKKAIVEASSLPMSIIIVGIGDADFESMNELDSDNKCLVSNGRYAARDIVQFVAFRDFLQTIDSYTASYNLAKALLAEIPNQLVGYMKYRNICPKKKQLP